MLREKIFISSEQLEEFHNDNIKSHKKPEFHLLFRINIFEITTEVVQIYCSPPLRLFRVNYYYS